ncbi:MAG TPA: valine--tRNA ligase [Chitinophagaceae bacterium]|nr:valine--tRNA ligase [Chitinophagaceae bacterium]
MDIQKQFNAKDAEAKWYQHWMDQGYFKSTPDEREAYTIVMPPPNVTGVLHMGHALNNTVQDILIRRAKSQGYNTCWVPGTDHASIATEAKVVEMLHEKGIDKNNLSREEFLEHAWSWKEKYGNIILEQLKKLGCALDWDRTTFTLDDHYYKAVIDTFIDLYKKGKVYRAARMINWDPVALTALSDEEVYHKDTQSKLFYVSYKIKDSDETVTIATVRPETILGDTAICVHPEDPRFKHLIGQKAIIPIVGREVPIIADDYVDMEFGTGALKVTPAHDMNDHELGQKHQLEVIDIFNDNGTINQLFPKYEGKDREVVRKEIVEDLKAAGHLVKVEDYTNQVGFSERTHAVVEPKLSMQWWCKMDEMAEPALKSVMDDVVNFSPPKFKNLYRHWMENIRDWCISRQLWWGHRIPAWYDESGDFYVAENVEEAFQQYQKKNPSGKIEDLKQDEDVLDTWFSSWLWPTEVFNKEGVDFEKELAYYYPTQTLVTAPEIIFFWVARMIMAGHEFVGDIPFEHVYFTGIVRDKEGKKMSKSLGNSPDLLELIDIHGADAARFSVLIASPAGNDILYDEAFLEQGKHFSHKMWNAMRLVKMWESKQEDRAMNDIETFSINWMKAKVNASKKTIQQYFDQFQLSEALKLIYSLIWDDFCSWYLEWMKPGKDATISKAAYEESIAIFDELLLILHPFMPFVTEEIHQHLLPEAGDLMGKQLSNAVDVEQSILADGLKLQKLITAIRDAKQHNQLKPKDLIQIYYLSKEGDFYKQVENILKQQVFADVIEETSTAMEQCINIVVNADKLYIQSEVEIDYSIQVEKLTQELAHLERFLVSIEKKLNNKRFVEHAKKEIVDLEKKKQADTLAKIASLKESLEQMSS